MFTHHPFFFHYGRNLISLCNLRYLCLGEIFLFYFFGKFSLLFSSLFSLSLSFFFFGNSYWWQLLPASTSLIVWHFLSCLPSFCLFIRSFKKDFLNLITYFSCHIFILNCSSVFYLFFSCFQFFCSCLMDIKIYCTSRNIVYIYHIYLFCFQQSLCCLLASFFILLFILICVM